MAASASFLPPSERLRNLFPGRTETIFSALRNVELESLADTRKFDFRGLEARRVPMMTEGDEVALANQLETLTV